MGWAKVVTHKIHTIKKAPKPLRRSAPMGDKNAKRFEDVIFISVYVFIDGLKSVAHLISIGFYGID
jgi:hypothetical protein